MKVKMSLSRVRLFDPPKTTQSMEFSRPEYWSGQPFPYSRGSSQPRGQTQVSRIAANSLPAEPQGKPKNIGVGSLSLLQWIFPAQELNRCLLYCRWILYQLSYQGSPVKQLHPNSITASYFLLIGLKKYMKQQLFSPLPPRCIHIMNIQIWPLKNKVTKQCVFCGGSSYLCFIPLFHEKFHYLQNLGMHSLVIFVFFSLSSFNSNQCLPTVLPVFLFSPLIL